jgi:hypothetical protein
MVQDNSYATGDATPASSSDGTKAPDNDTEVNAEGTDSGAKSGEPAGKQRNAEGRINQLLGRIKELEGKLDKIGSTQPSAPVPGAQPAPLTPELQRAKEQIRTLGYVDEDTLEKKIRQMEDRILLDTEHGRMETTYTGSDGRPKYDRAEVERFMRSKGVYNPEIAYEQLYKAELFDWNLKQAQKNKPATPRSDSGQAKGAEQKGGTQTITRELIRDKMSTPEWRTFYESNREKILSLMQKGQL